MNKSDLQSLNCNISSACGTSMSTGPEIITSHGLRETGWNKLTRELEQHGAGRAGTLAPSEQKLLFLVLFWYRKGHILLTGQLRQKRVARPILNHLSRGALIFRTSHQSGAMCGAVPSSVVGCLSANDKDGGETEDGRKEGSSVSSCLSSTSPYTTLWPI